MSRIPTTFRAYVAEASASGGVTRGVRPFAAVDLPPGDVEVRVDWSSVNFKDGLATIRDGKVARINPPSRPPSPTARPGPRATRRRSPPAAV